MASVPHYVGVAIGLPDLAGSIWLSTEALILQNQILSSNKWEERVNVKQLLFTQFRNLNLEKIMAF
jgi:hypothetical protein